VELCTCISCRGCNPTAVSAKNGGCPGRGPPWALHTAPAHLGPTNPVRPSQPAEVALVTATGCVRRTVNSCLMKRRKVNDDPLPTQVKSNMPVNLQTSPYVEDAPWQAPRRMEPPKPNSAFFSLSNHVYGGGPSTLAPLRLRTPQAASARICTTAPRTQVAK
jgi:hypothetical protein